MKINLNINSKISSRKKRRGLTFASCVKIQSWWTNLQSNFCQWLNSSAGGYYNGL